ncbi:MAG: formylglycine-generating enzyme family protein [Deltaproteobacteria bacterium]|nr:formylglycine-generating enzyme family protein [Deltaproteobacteria bacterium]
MTEQFSKRKFGHFLFIAAITVISWLLAQGSLWAAENKPWQDPHPYPGDLTLPGPAGSSFVFRPISVSGEGGPLAGKKFLMGDPAGDFRSPPTAVVVGGAFASDSDNNAWIYYLGKYEVTQAQYRAVMGDAGGGEASGNFPVTGISWFDATQFTDKLNTWLYANALDKIPASGSFPGFVRLPTEAEWEYAARGGSAVDATVFDMDTPYGKDLAKYEWFSGPSSSHNKIQEAGKLLGNPLGLHDMLGNVREMTQNHYYIEYYQGRSGGFTARGGHYLVAEADLRSAMRAEEPYYLGAKDKGMRANVKPTMGFRLLLSAPVLTGREAIADIEEAWDEYRAGAGAALPAAVSTAPVGAQEAVPAQEALLRLGRIKEGLQQAGIAENFKQDMAATESSLRSMAQVRKQADEDSAKVWAKIAGERGMYLATNLKGLEVTKDAPTENLRRRAEQFAYNVDNGLENYSEIMAELAKLPAEAVLKGFDWHSGSIQAKMERAMLSSKPEAAEQVKDIQAQLAWIKTTRAHYEKYVREKRFDAASWRKDYAPTQP